ncbi:MAG: hypothetical protein LBV60_12905, partial [Streptomyces sp.]|nr:hypothetical protein [Streptomyces sp.]
MLYDALVAESRRNDSLDDVRCAALERVRWLVDLLERQRKGPVWDAAAALRGPEEYERIQAIRAATQAEIDGRLAACGDEEGRAAVLCLMLAAHSNGMGPLISRVRGWTPDEVTVMLRRATEYDGDFWYADPLALVLNAADQLDTDGRRVIMPWLRHVHTKIMDTAVEARPRVSLTQRLRVLIASVDETYIPEGLIPADAPWACPLRDRAKTSPTLELARFVRHLASLSAPRPSQRWRRTCLELVDAASARELMADVLRALAEDEPLCSRENGAHDGWFDDRYHYHYVVQQCDGDLARGVVWASALTGGPAAVQHLDALVLRTSGLGAGVVQDLKLAGAAINALAETGDPASLEALWRLRSRTKHRALRKQLDTALVTAAGKQGITAEQLIERSVPDHGLASDGSLERELGEHRVRVAIEEASTVRLTFTRPDGKTSRTAPAAVKDGFPDELQELKALAKEVRGT